MTIARMSPLSCGLSLAVTAALLYLACAVVVALDPGALAAGLRLIVHGLSLPELAPAAGGLSWTAVMIGSLAIAGYSFIAGVLFGVMHRWIGGSTG